MATEGVSDLQSNAVTRQPTVLVFYWGCFMEQSNGSQARVVEAIDHLREVAHVTVYVYTNNPGSPWTDAACRTFEERFPGVALLLEEETLPLRLAQKLKKLVVHLRPSRAKSVLGLQVPFAAPRLARWKTDHPDALYFVNYVENVALVNGVPWERTIVETHDLQYFRRAKPAGDLASTRNLFRLRHEVATLAASHGIVSISRTEDYVYRNLAPASQVFYIPTYKRPVPVDLPDADSYDYDLMFVASPNSINRLGFAKFVAANAEWIDNYRIAVCGNLCDVPEIRELASRHASISLLGFQSDLLPVYGRSKACISPSEGTGLNIKIVDALRHTKPVFATREAMSALPPGSEACVFHLARDQVERVLEDPAALAKARRAAAVYFEQFADAGDLLELDMFLRRMAEQARPSVPQQ